MRRLSVSNGQIYSPPRSKLKSILSFALLIILLTGALVQVIWLNEHSLRAVSGASMRPLLNNYGNVDTGDMVLVGKRTNVAIGDVIIFDNKTETGEESKQLIKRVIALEGDNVNMVLREDIKSVDVYINGALLDEPYVLQATNQADFLALAQKYRNFKTQSGWTYWKEADHKLVTTADGGIIVPSGCMFCMGDNRIDSFDCRSFGPVPIEWCEGIVEGVLLKDSFYTHILSSLYGIFG